MEDEVKKLYNLTYEGKQYISTIAPTNYPPDNYSFVEITYDNSIVISVKSNYILNGKKEDIILSDLDFFKYLKEIKHIKPLKEAERTKEAEDTEFMGLEKQPENKTELIFILSVCSYLVYFHFMNLPCELSLDLLDNNAIKFFLSSAKMSNPLFEAWNLQVDTFAKSFSYLFPSKFSLQKEEILENNAQEQK